jgi:hypothetical protein
MPSPEPPRARRGFETCTHDGSDWGAAAGMGRMCCGYYGRKGGRLLTVGHRWPDKREKVGSSSLPRPMLEGPSADSLSPPALSLTCPAILKGLTPT